MLKLGVGVFLCHHLRTWQPSPDQTKWCGQSSLYWPWSEVAHSAVWEMSKFSQAVISPGWPSCFNSDNHWVIYYFFLSLSSPPSPCPSSATGKKKKKILYLLNKTTDRFDSPFWINRLEQSLFLRKIILHPLCPTLSCCSTTWILIPQKAFGFCIPYRSF